MNIASFVANLEKRGISLRCRDDALSVTAADGLLDEALLVQLRQHKSEILQLLKTLEPPAAERQAVPVVGYQPAPLSEAQKRFWFANQLRSAPAYHLSAAFILDGPLHGPTLERAIAAVAANHPVLRTRIVEVQGELETRTDDAGRFRLVTADAESERHALEMASIEASRPFNLGADWPLRASLLRTGASQHVLVLSLHHICCDGVSIDLMVREIGAAHARIGQGLPPDSRPGPQYADVARWQARAWETGRFNPSLDYWRTRLDGAPDHVHLPLRPVAPFGQQPARTTRVALDAGLSAAVDAFAAQARTTPFAVLCATFAALLSRYSGDEDLVIGSPTANRSLPEFQSVVGPMVNTVALRFHLPPEISFDALVAQTSHTVREAIVHSDVPFERVVDQLNPDSRRSGSPFFNVMFAAQPMSLDRFQLEGTRTRPIDLPATCAKFDLTVLLADDACGKSLAFEYREDRFEPRQIEDMAPRFRCLLEQLLEAPSRSVRDHALLRAAEDPLSAATQDGQLPPTSTICTRIAEQAARTPDAPAAIRGDEVITYRDLEALAERYAATLSSRGVGPADTVAVCVDPSPDFLACVIAAQKLGAAYLPLDPTYPSDRLRGMVEDARPQVIVAESAYCDRFRPGKSAPVLDLRTLSETTAAEPRPRYPDVLAKGEAANLPLYVIFTSGSTGRPKGAVITHRNFFNLLEWYCDAFAIGPDSRILLVSALGFDLTQKNLFAPLLRGGAVVFREETNFDPRRIAEAVERHAITSLNCTPSAFQAIVERAAADDWRALRSLRHVFLGGEPILAAHLRAWMTSPHCAAEVVNTYGPTECADVCAFKRLPRDPDAWPYAIPIGQPLPHFCLVAVDEGGLPVPIGAVGELVVGGVGVGWGYLGQHGLTADRFRPVTFGEPGQRFYFTGDLVRRSIDNDFVFLGRRDGQIKLRGHRIELGEIECAIERQAGVSRAAAHVQRDEGHEPRLVAFFVTHPDADPDVQEMLLALRRDLPEPAVPQALRRLDALPHTPSGKVDRRALPAVDFTSPVGSTVLPFVPPATETERLVATVWCDVLGIAQVGRHDRFFDVGGHSLLATRVVTRLVFKHGLPVEISDLFEAPGIADLCARLDARAGRGQVAPHLPALDPASAAQDGSWPLSLAQERLLFLARMDGPNATYNMSSGLHLTGRLDLPALRSALHQLTVRHAVLAMRFETRGDRTVQVPDPRDFAELAAQAVARDELDETVAWLAGQPFDLDHDRVMRASLLRLDADDHVLILSLHHIACDGWSVAIIRRELKALYTEAASGRTPTPPLRQTNYFDFTAWQRSRLSGAHLQALDNYWKQQLRDLPALCTLPTDRPRPEIARHAGAVRRFVVPAELKQGLKSLAGSHDASLYMVLLAAFDALAFRLTGHTQIVVGTPVANRVRPEFEDLIGLFVNTLVIRQDVAGEAPFATLLANVRRTLLQAYEHQDMPFDRLVDVLKPERSLSHSPLFQMLFVMDTGVLEAFEMADIHATPVELDGSVSKFDLNIHLVETSESLSGYIEYNVGLYEAPTIERLVQMYLGVLGQVATCPALPVSDLDLSPPPAADELAKLTDLRAEVPTASTVPELVRATAHAHPARRALSLGSEAWTYGTLIANAEAMALRISEEVHEADTPIGVLMGRTPRRATALLAVQMAGCPYVPLEPSLPDERLRQTVETAALRYLITDDAARVAAFGPGLKVIDLDRAPAHPSAPGLPTLHPDQLAYVMTTSGSTGTPKGVLVPHRGVAHHLAFLVQARGVTPDDKVLQVTNFNFDPSVRDLFGTWVAGAEAVLLGPDQASDPAAILDALVRNRITKVFSLTPTLLRAIVAFAGGRYRPSDFRLDTLMLSGERVTAEDCRQCWSVFGEHLTLVNQYGPTETTMTSAHHAVQRSDLDRQRIPVGRAHANTRIHIVDANLRALPIGVVGEVCIEGIGLSRAYADDPARTAESFVCRPDALRGTPLGTRLYRTGDLGRLLDDGSLDLLGRNDAQIKLRGNRIELGEIEATFLAHEHVQHAACRLYDDARGEPQLAVFVVCAPPHSFDEPRLRQHAATRLPIYMHPAVIEAVPHLPLTATGKVDRKRLPSPRLRMAAEVPQAARPETPTERLVAATWQRVLEIGGVGLDTNFFDLGGNSLRLMAVQLALREAGRLDLKIVDLFRYPTVRGLSRFIDGSTQGPGGPPAAVPVLSGDMADRIALRRAAQSRRATRQSTSKEQEA